MTLASLGNYVAEIKRSRSWGRRREPAADSPRVRLDRQAFGFYRATAMHLHDRLPPASLAQAAKGGLQDGDPRAALLGLHARVEGVKPESWEHADLVQIWFRYSDYVVPRARVGLFTIGTMPRDPEAARALNLLADEVHRVLNGNALRTRDVVTRIGGLPHPLVIRAVCATGRVHIRWDARTVELIPVEPQAIDPEEARLELSRVFLRWFGPSRPEQFSKWAMLSRADTLATWNALRRELVEVEVEGRGRWTLAPEVDAFRSVSRPSGVRFLALGDPYLYKDQDFLVRTAPRPDPQLEGAVTRRLVNSLKGRVLMDGEIVGAFGRVQANITIRPWIRLGRGRKAAIESEAATLENPLGRPPKIHWLDG